MICVVVEECVRQLVAGGFTELKEKDTWKIQPLGKVQKSSIHRCIYSMLAKKKNVLVLVFMSGS